MPFTLPLLLFALVANAGFFLPKLPDAGQEVAALPYADKVVHVAVFALTAWALLRGYAWVKATGSIRRRQVLAILAALVAWAWIIELIQSLMPLRAADPADVLADCVGILVGLGIFAVEARGGGGGPPPPPPPPPPGPGARAPPPPPPPPRA
ncbi:MAG: VanZ family protein, partial [Dermabacter sp.]|nr:VanZ family protein [Dermabacter sp.]